MVDLHYCQVSRGKLVAPVDGAYQIRIGTHARQVNQYILATQSIKVKHILLDTQCKQLNLYLLAAQSQQVKQNP